jgi:hypothetical protein
MRNAGNVLRVLCAIGLACTTGASISQTPAQLEYERQQREYRQQQERQRQEEERIRKLNEDIRRQEEESAKARRAEEDARARTRNQEFDQNMQDAQRRQQSAPGQGSAASAQLEQARQTWLKRPPLPPDKNPLLGRWKRPSSPRANSSDPFAGVQAMLQGGLCEILFGGGVFEFRPDRLVGMDGRTPEMELDRVEYRGDSKRVIVIPKTTFKLMDFDVEGPDRINWASQNCVLVRAGAATGSAAASKPAQADSQRTSAGAGGVLVLSVGAASAENKVAGRQFLILNEDPQVALIKGGIKSTPDGSVLQNWLRACTQRTPNCEKGAQALRPHSIGIATTDANGRAQTGALPAGRYWVYSEAKVGDKRLMWSQLVDVKGGTQSLTFDQRNAIPVE